MANQNDDVSIAPLLRSILVWCYLRNSSNFYKAAVPAVILLLLRMCQMTIQILLDYLVMSEEVFLGAIQSFWGRAEFQYTAGNLSHYHFVFSLHSNDLKLEELVASTRSQNHHMCELLVRFQIGLLKNEAVLERISAKFVSVQMHTCERESNRCMKKRDAKS